MNLHQLASKMGVPPASLYLRAKRGLLPIDEKGKVSESDAHFLIAGVTLKRAEQVLGKSRNTIQSDCMVGNLEVRRFGRKFYIILPKGYYYSQEKGTYFFHDPDQGWIQVSNVPEGAYRLTQRPPAHTDLKMES